MYEVDKQHKGRPLSANRWSSVSLSLSVSHCAVVVSGWKKELKKPLQDELVGRSFISAACESLEARFFRQASERAGKSRRRSW